MRHDIHIHKTVRHEFGFKKDGLVHQTGEFIGDVAWALFAPREVSAAELRGLWIFNVIFAILIFIICWRF